SGSAHLGEAGRAHPLACAARGPEEPLCAASRPAADPAAGGRPRRGRGTVRPDRDDQPDAVPEGSRGMRGDRRRDGAAGPAHVPAAARGALLEPRAEAGVIGTEADVSPPLSCPRLLRASMNTG